jgi:uncharacterized protein YejL (UPF0352 family)
MVDKEKNIEEQLKPIITNMLSVLTKEKPKDSVHYII